MKRFLAMAMLTVGAVAQADEPRAAPAANNPDEVALRRQPYRIGTLVSFASDPAFSAAARRDAIHDLASRLDASFAAVWQLSVTETQSLAPDGSDGVKRLTSTSLPDDVGAFDRTVFVAFDRIGSRTVATVRTWNPVPRWLSPVATAETLDPRSAAAVAAELVAGQFRPTLAVDDVRGETVQLTLQAGDFPTGDPDQPQLEPGDLLVPMFRYLDRAKNVRRIDVLPFTYLVVEQVDGPAVAAQLVTGLRSPLGTNRRRGVDLWAVAIRRTLPASTLRLSLRGSADRPLSGNRVVATTFEPGAQPEAKPEDADAPRDPPLRLITDRQGLVTVPAGPAPIVWLSVLSGEALLAKLPFAPGVDALAPLELPDDSIRLGAEREIDLLKGRLVDAVARRATLIARIRAQAKLGDWKGVDKLLAELDTHPGVADFERQLVTIRVSATEAAQGRKDRVGEARVRQLASDTQQLIRRYLDPDKIATLREELRELRQIDVK